jgi:hypothetical protein
VGGRRGAWLGFEPTTSADLEERLTSRSAEVKCGVCRVGDSRAFVPMWGPRQSAVDSDGSRPKRQEVCYPVRR